MPRCARLKEPNAMYHIMIRSITEVLLFRDDADKDTYISLISTAEKKYYFNLYSFCLMDNHAHFILDPLGGDISKIMHFINTVYATYYNAKYKRIGPVFQGRFKSKIISSDRYLMTASVYIHCNPKDIPSFKKQPQLYKYSSLMDYIQNSDRFGILNTHFISTLFGLSHPTNHLNYVHLCLHSSPEEETACTSLNFTPKNYEYRSERIVILRATTPEQIINTVGSYFNFNFNKIHAKRHKKYLEFRAICCYLMVCLGNIPQKVIALIFGNITQSSISKLVTKGMNLIDKYPSLFTSLII